MALLENKGIRRAYKQTGSEWERGYRKQVESSWQEHESTEHEDMAVTAREVWGHWVGG